MQVARHNIHGHQCYVGRHHQRRHHQPEEDIAAWEILLCKSIARERIEKAVKDGNTQRDNHTIEKPTPIIAGRGEKALEILNVSMEGKNIGWDLHCKIGWCQSC